MKKVTNIRQRKTDHIKINLEQDVRSSLSTGLEKYSFVHEALPEINLDDVDMSQTLFGKMLAAPILISSMTGGTEDAKNINRRLAEAAQKFNIAMGVGSQRVALEEVNTTRSFSITREVAPGALLFANLGAIQLNLGYTIDHCRRAVDMLHADALILHVNPLQEALQSNGDTAFANLAKKIESVCRKLEVPVIVKEVGWGISRRTAKLLNDCGVSAIDVAGAGGTSWSQVEMHRAPDEFSKSLAATFSSWGIPTTDSIINIKTAVPKMIVFASGGLINGIDIAKCVGLGATLGGMAGNFLHAAIISRKMVEELVKLTIKQIQVAMFSSGHKDLNSLLGSLVVINHK